MTKNTQNHALRDKTQILNLNVAKLCIQLRIQKSKYRKVKKSSDYSKKLSQPFHN